MITAVFRIAVFVTVVTMTSSSLIIPTIDMATVRLGEAIHLSCVISLTSTESVSEVLWYRNSSFNSYGSIDVTRCTGASACPEGSTTDDRGTVRYEKGTSNDAVLTLTINSSTLQDNTSFSCGIIRVGGSSQTSSGISVTVYVPEATSPIPGHQTTRAETTEFTTNTPDTTTGDRSISSHQTSTAPTTSSETTTKAISPIVTETSTDQTDVVTASLQQPIVSSGTTDEKGSFYPSISGSICRETSVVEAPVSLAVPILAVAVSACLVTIIILLFIIAYLVSSRKSTSKDAVPRLGLRSPEGVASSVTRQVNGPMYQNTSQPHTYENARSNSLHRDGDKSTIEQPSTVDTSPTHYEPVQAGGGSTRHTGAQRHPGRRVQDTSAVTTGDVESGYQDLEMTNQPQAEYTMLDLAIRNE